MADRGCLSWSSALSKLARSRSSSARRFSRAVISLLRESSAAIQYHAFKARIVCVSKPNLLLPGRMASQLRSSRSRNSLCQRVTHPEARNVETALPVTRHANYRARRQQLRLPAQTGAMALLRSTRRCEPTPAFRYSIRCAPEVSVTERRKAT